MSRLNITITVVLHCFFPRLTHLAFIGWFKTIAVIKSKSLCVSVNHGVIGGDGGGGLYPNLL